MIRRYDGVRELRVALRKESVDRNLVVAGVFKGVRPSLSARRAWIEIIWVLQS